MTVQGRHNTSIARTWGSIPTLDIGRGKGRQEPVSCPPTPPRTRHDRVAGNSLGRLLLLPVLAGMALLGPGLVKAANTWQTDAPSLATARQGLAATTAPCPAPSTGTCLYAIGGQLDSFNVLSTVEYYNPNTGKSGSWHSGPSLAASRSYLGATTAPCPMPSVGTCIYAIGGYSGIVLSSVEYYDPSAGPSGSWHSAPALGTTRYALGAATAPCPSASPSPGTCLYAIAGYGNSALSSVEYYDPRTGTGGSWHTAPSLALARSFLGATTAPCPPPSTGTCLYAIGGFDNGNTALSSVEYYDPRTGTGGNWQSAPSLGTARAFVGATTAPCPSPTIGTCLYAIGGLDGSHNPVGSVEYYAPSTGPSGNWQIAPSVVTALYLFGTTTGPCPSPATGTCLYAIAGTSDGTSLKSVTYYAPSASPTMALLSHTHLLHSHSRLVVSWHLTHRSGVLGFRVYAGRQELTAHTIPTHASPRYRAVFQTHATGPVRVHVLWADGHSVSIAVH